MTNLKESMETVITNTQKRVSENGKEDLKGVANGSTDVTLTATANVNTSNISYLWTEDAVVPKDGWINVNEKSTEKILNTTSDGEFWIKDEAGNMACRGFYVKIHEHVDSCYGTLTRILQIFRFGSRGWCHWLGLLVGM